MDRTSFSSTSHRCSIRLRYGNLGGHLELFGHVSQTVPEQFLQCGRVHYPSESSHCHQGIPLPLPVGGTCQSNIHMNVRNQGFSAERCSDHNTASVGLPSPYSASLCHFFLR